MSHPTHHNNTNFFAELTMMHEYGLTLLVQLIVTIWPPVEKEYFF